MKTKLFMVTSYHLLTITQALIWTGNLDLQPMTDANKDPDNSSSAFTFIDNLGPVGGTNFTDAFQKA